jgi:hypothetical protein
MNKMVINKETPVYAQGETQYSILRYAAMAAKWKEVGIGLGLHYAMLMHCA